MPHYKAEWNTRQNSIIGNTRQNEQKNQITTKNINKKPKINIHLKKKLNKKKMAADKTQTKQNN